MTFNNRSCSRLLLSTAQKRFPAGRNASFRSGIQFVKPATTELREVANKIFLSKKRRKEKMQTRRVFTNVCNNVFSVRRIVMHLADTYRSPARRWRNDAHANIYCCFRKNAWQHRKQATSHERYKVSSIMQPWNHEEDKSNRSQYVFVFTWAELINSSFVNN